MTAEEPDPADFGVWVPGIPVLLEKLFASMGVNEDGWVYSLVMDGIVAGVGAVLGFVPQMLILFFFLAILEDCGYMARVRIHHGPYLPQVRPFRQKFYPYADRFRLRRAGRYGQPHH